MSSDDIAYETGLTKNADYETKLTKTIDYLHTPRNIKLTRNTRDQYNKVVKDISIIKFPRHDDIWDHSIFNRKTRAKL